MPGHFTDEELVAMGKNLPDLVERRMLLRREMEEVNQKIADAVVIEHTFGKSQAELAKLLGVTKQRINQMIRLGF